jgi:hypothetical protein
MQDQNMCRHYISLQVRYLAGFAPLQLIFRSDVETSSHAGHLSRWYLQESGERRERILLFTVSRNGD